MSTAGAVGLAENLKGNEIQLWRFVTSFLEKSLAMPAMSPSVLGRLRGSSGEFRRDHSKNKLSSKSFLPGMSWGERKTWCSCTEAGRGRHMTEPSYQQTSPSSEWWSQVSIQEAAPPTWLSHLQNSPWQSHWGRQQWMTETEDFFFLNFVSFNKKEQYEERMSSWKHICTGKWANWRS